MIRYADPTRCPDCGSPIPASPVACAQCGLTLTGPDAAALFVTLQAADRILGVLRAEMPQDVASRQEAGGEMPQEVASRRGGLSGASVPKILLGLGALCLLVAAVIFLAVAWSWLGVGGRTAVLVGLTAVSGGLAVWLGRRGLRIAAESLSVVAFGLLALDVVGADNAGWLGDLSGYGLVTVTGLVVGGTAWALAWVTTRGERDLLAPQAFAGLGLGIVPVGVSGTTTSDAAVLVASCLALAGLAVLAHRLRIGLLPWILGILAALWWVPLAGLGVVRMAEDPTVAALWPDLQAWPALCATGLLLLGAWLLRGWPVVPQALAGLAAALLTLILVFPALDNGLTAATLAVLAFVVGWSASLLAAPASWRLTPTIALLAAATLPATIWLLQAWTALETVVGSGPAWESPASVRIDPIRVDGHPSLFVAITAAGCLAVVALAGYVTSPPTFARRQSPFLLAAVCLAGVGTLTAYAVPLALVPAGLLVIGGGLLGWGLPRVDRRADVAMTGALVLGVAAVVTALPSAVLTLVAALVVLAGAAVVAARGAEPVRRTVAECLVPLAAAVAVAAGTDVVGVDQVWRGLPVLIVVGGLALARPRITVEVPAAVAAGIASVAALAAEAPVPERQDSVPLEVYLVVAGALVTASAVLHPHRRLLGWPGAVLLVLASWVRLADLGVTAPEAYTMPSAVALIVFGLYRLRRDPSAGTMLTLSPGLALATVPTLLQVLAGEQVSWRALLLGLGCLALVLAGTRLRWSAPLVVGATVGAALVLYEASPYAAAAPLWVVIALAGTVLTVVGVTWESRLRNLRDATAYLSRLR